jgi:hypothetical protein
MIVVRYENPSLHPSERPNSREFDAAEAVQALAFVRQVSRSCPLDLIGMDFTDNESYAALERVDG